MRSRVLAAGVILALLSTACGTVRPPTPTSTAAPSPTRAAATPTRTGTPAPAAPTATLAPGATFTPTRAQASATPTTRPLSPTTSGTGASPSTDGAPQTVLDYWAAVNARDYAKAYRFWAQNGAASGQTLDQFSAGFADTVEVTVQIGAYSRTGDTATVPVTLTSISNVHGNPTADQIVQAYHGTYRLQPTGQTVSITAANILEIQSPSLPPADIATAVSGLQSYLRSLIARQYGLAYTYWSNLGAATGQTFAEFHQGFLTTDEIRYRLGTPKEGAAAGSLYTEITAILVARHTDGTTVTYCATYTMRRANVPPFEKMGWHIYTGKAQVITTIPLDGAQADSLLATGCSSQ